MRPDELVTVAAWLYYEGGLKQEEVARRLGVSRVKVARLLAQARAEGVVQFVITRPLPEPFRLAEALCARYGLEAAVVVPSAGSAEATLDALGAAGADYLASRLEPGLRLGLGWSSTARRLAPYLRRLRPVKDCTVVELAGSFLGQANPYAISGPLAAALGCGLEALPVPVLVESPAARAALLAEGRIAAALAAGRECDLAVVGIGQVGPESTTVRTGMVAPEEMALIEKAGAVGDVLMRFFDTAGRPVQTPLDERVLAVGWDDFLQIPQRVAMAAGAAKLPAIRAALRGGLFQALITDAPTAARLLEDRPTPAPGG
ncbi:sugar-binding transcriptional regulator [Deinococcota bacterium DY0809b]